MTKPTTRTLTRSAPLPTQNMAYGFYGTCRLNAMGDDDLEATPAHHAQAQGHYDTVFKILQQRAHRTPDSKIREFLDSTYGRHMADEFSDHLYDGKSAETYVPSVGFVRNGRFV